MASGYIVTVKAFIACHPRDRETMAGADQIIDALDAWLCQQIGADNYEIADRWVARRRNGGGAAGSGRKPDGEPAEQLPAAAPASTLDHETARLLDIPEMVLR